MEYSGGSGSAGGIKRGRGKALKLPAGEWTDEKPFDAALEIAFALRREHEPSLAPLHRQSKGCQRSRLLASSAIAPALRERTALLLLKQPAAAGFCGAVLKGPPARRR